LLKIILIFNFDHYVAGFITSAYPWQKPNRCSHKQGFYYKLCLRVQMIKRVVKARTSLSSILPGRLF